MSSGLGDTGLTCCGSPASEMPGHVRCRDACPSENVFEYPCHASKNAHLWRVVLSQPEKAGLRDKKGPVARETLGPFRRLLLTVTARSSCAQMAAAVLVWRLKPVSGDRAIRCMVEFTGQDAANDGLRLVVGHPGERQGLDLPAGQSSSATPTA